MNGYIADPCLHPIHEDLNCFIQPALQAYQDIRRPTKTTVRSWKETQYNHLNWETNEVSATTPEAFLVY